MAHIVTAGELLDGHSVLDIECLDRIYLNAYVPILQSSGQVVAFMTQHLGKPIPSPALMEQIGTRFRRAVESYASLERDPVGEVRQGRPEDRRDAAAPAGAGRDREVRGGRGRRLAGVPAGLVRVPARHPGRGAAVHVREGRPPGDLLLLLPVGRGLRRRRSSRSAPTSPTRPRSGSTGTSGPSGRRSRPGSGSPSCPTGSRPAMTPPRCRPSATGSSRAPSRSSPSGGCTGIPMPFGSKDRDAGYWWECSMRQVEVSRTIVFDAPAPGPVVLRGADRRQPGPGPPGERGDHLRPAGPLRHPRDLPHRHRPPRHRPGRQGRGGEHLLQALAGQAVPERGPGDADRDRHQLPPRPCLQRPAAQPGRAAGQGPGGQRPYPECRARRPGHRPCESSLRADRAPVRDRGRAEDPGPAVRRSSGHGPGRRPLLHPAGSHRHHQQEPARLDDRTARRPLHRPVR